MIKQETKTQLSQRLMAMTEQMYEYACNGAWDEVRAIDDNRQEIVREALQSGASIADDELSNQLRKYQDAILKMAINERDRLTDEYRESRNKASQCNYYLKNRME